MINTLGKFLIVLGLFLIILGVGVIVFSKFKIPFLGRLPGDILIKKDNFIFYFPLATSILVSIVLSLILYLIFRK
ncbi:MAG: DUF2905 domain-containing protein [Candidatus Omnitrophota bacterium]|nr:DUF2905 domain-containing protein [Candidatus Omnitrophota bacterium]RKY33933.1 MAG: DUF2905 domain-containing protein [Candidatus Omnitrophota bacterium]RKY46483.1 MAG: DUF2905 domain-containing protein [Candidatus Omnitrophota bacterium]HDN86621.1 DUF2905 domain-containing protein [Candidatus Omnitrophota bacterium]